MYYLLNLLILISHRGQSRTPKATTLEIFVSTINDLKPLTVGIKNFVREVTGVVHVRD